MEEQRVSSGRNKPTLWRPYCGCIVYVLAMGAILLGVIIAILEGVPGDIMRWGRSFQFPAIEARFQPIAEQLATVTTDVLVNETHAIGNATFMTNKDYTGIVGGNFTKLYGTNRSFDYVLGDYTRYLSSKPEWKAFPGNYQNFLSVENKDGTAEVFIEIRNKTEVPAAVRDKYAIFYEVMLEYGDPVLWRP